MGKYELEDFYFDLSRISFIVIGKSLVYAFNHNGSGQGAFRRDETVQIALQVLQPIFLFGAQARWT